MNLPTAGGTDVIDCFDRDAGVADFGSVEEVHQEILESTVEVDDAELERYLGGATIDLPKLRACFVEAMNRGHLVPILFTAARTEVGVDDLLHVLVEEAPSPANCAPAAPAPPRRRAGGGPLRPRRRRCWGRSSRSPTDPYLGKLASIRLLQGTFDARTPFVCGPEGRPLEGRPPAQGGGARPPRDRVGGLRRRPGHGGQDRRSARRPDPAQPRHREQLRAGAAPLPAADDLAGGRAQEEGRRDQALDAR